MWNESFFGCRAPFGSLYSSFCDQRWNVARPETRWTKAAAFCRWNPPAATAAFIPQTTWQRCGVLAVGGRENRSRLPRRARRNSPRHPRGAVQIFSSRPILYWLFSERNRNQFRNLLSSLCDMMNSHDGRTDGRFCLR